MKKEKVRVVSNLMNEYLQASEYCDIMDYNFSHHQNSPYIYALLQSNHMFED